MASIDTTAAALNAAQQRLAAQQATINNLQARQRTLEDTVGRAVADGTEAPDAKSDLAAVRDELEHQLLALTHVTRDLEAAQARHKAAVRAGYVAAMGTLAAQLQATGDEFEAAVNSVRPARDAFVATGRKMRDLAQAHGHTRPEAFDVGSLAADIEAYRLRAEGAPAYGAPISTLLRFAVSQLEAA